VYVQTFQICVPDHVAENFLGISASDFIGLSEADKSKLLTKFSPQGGLRVTVRMTQQEYQQKKRVTMVVDEIGQVVAG
jgi:hypothetical protein